MFYRDVKPKNGLDAFFTQASFDRFNNTKTLQDTILYRIEEMKRLGVTENKPVVTKVAPKSDLLFIKSEDKNEDTVHQDLGETSNQQNERKKQSKGAKKKEKYVYDLQYVILSKYHIIKIDSTYHTMPLQIMFVWTSKIHRNTISPKIKYSYNRTVIIVNVSMKIVHH